MQILKKVRYQLVLYFCFWPFLGYSQIGSETVLFGGSINFSYVSRGHPEVQWRINPKLGFSISERRMVGIEANFYPSEGDLEFDRYKSVGGFYRRYFNFPRFWLYAQTGYHINWSKYQKPLIGSFTIGPGLAFFLSDRIAFESTLHYKWNLRFLEYSTHYLFYDVGVSFYF